MDSKGNYAGGQAFGAQSTATFNKYRYYGINDLLADGGAWNGLWNWWNSVKSMKYTVP